MKIEKSNQKGITLVALVVTIVILLILSGISISFVLGDNGIISKATQGKTNYELASDDEQNLLNNVSDWMDQELESINNKKEPMLPSTDESKPYLPNNFKQVENTNLDNGLVIKDKNGNEYVWIEVPKKSEVYKTAGLEITDFTTDNYTKIENDLHSYTSVYRGTTKASDIAYSKDQIGLEVADYNKLKQEMLKSVYQNGGFWVGRYEVGDSTSTETNSVRNTKSLISGVPVIKRNQQPYNFVTCSQAETLAKQFNPNINEYNTDLLFGVQWDLILKYFETKNTTQNELITDSTQWGNYGNAKFEIISGLYNEVNTENPSDFLTTWNNVNPKYTKQYGGYILISSGSTDRNMKQNVYDIAGNLFELTLEYSNNIYDQCNIRGGSYADNGAYDWAVYRAGRAPIAEDCYIGFRVSLYKK